jgi:hypothetical protein
VDAFLECNNKRVGTNIKPQARIVINNVLTFITDFFLIFFVLFFFIMAHVKHFNIVYFK